MDDPSALSAAWLARVAQAPVILGADDRSPLSSALLMASAGAATGPEDLPLGVELGAARGETGWRDPGWVARPMGWLSVGGLVPEGNGGDDEPGLVSARLRGEGRLYAGPVELALVPELGGDLAQTSAEIRLAEAWAGVHTAHWNAGFGLRDRWIGPGRHGSLTLTDHASPAPLGSVAWQSRAGERLGPVRLEGGLGWLNGARGDVDHPGWLLMDARWAATPWLEIGGTRMAIFGGEGRPTPDWGQLLVPTEPHIYDDPDLLLPDQDELAALDVRLTVPVRGLSGRLGLDVPVDYIELWWQYGGEDVIARELGPIPVPSLAGVANLYGAELASGSWLLTFEGARLLDDTFRWYTGHRVYHEGFTRDGRAMGHPAGGDSMSLWGAVTWLPNAWGAQVQAERRLRVGVVQAVGDNLLALSADERRTRLGVKVFHQRGPSWWHLDAEIERVVARDFVPGADAVAGRISLGR